jgi:hypothetical protein
MFTPFRQPTDCERDHAVGTSTGPERTLTLWATGVTIPAAGLLMRWVGIDEAGYGPNLGPLVMTAVVAEGPDGDPPDLWSDLSDRIDRAGGDPQRVWVDDSKQVYRNGTGLDRLEATALAAIVAAGRPLPTTLASLFSALDAGSIDDVELSLWQETESPLPRPEALAVVDNALACRAFEGARWSIVAVRSVVVGPARFNEGLSQSSSKAKVHFSAFVHLLSRLWDESGGGNDTHVRGDKHGGRHFYYEPLIGAFPDVWIDRGCEGPELSSYTLRRPGQRLDLDLRPKADSEDGLVALASMVSKAVREWWMAVFNAHWAARIPGIKPTAGYPGDSGRFRELIEPHCQARGLSPVLWWRDK